MHGLLLSCSSFIAVRAIYLFIWLHTVVVTTSITRSGYRTDLEREESEKDYLLKRANPHERKKDASIDTHFY